MIEDPFSKIKAYSSPMTKKELLGLYAVSVLLIVAGLFGIYMYAADLPSDPTHLLVSIAISLGGIALGLCVYFRHKIPTRVKIYSGCLAFTVVGIYMAANPHGSYRHSPEFVRFMGITGALFFGAGGLFVLYKDLKFHYEHIDEIGDVGEEEPVTDGIIRFNNADEMEIMEAIDKFDSEDSQKEVIKPRIVQRGVHSLLVLHDIGYSDFCYLFNWLVYRKTFAPDYSLRGWLKEPHLKVEGNTIVGPIMLYIPSDDKEYDNVYFVTLYGNCYKQEFANAQRLCEIHAHAVSSESYPEFDTIL